MVQALTGEGRHPVDTWQEYTRDMDRHSHRTLASGRWKGRPPPTADGLLRRMLAAPRMAWFVLSLLLVAGTSFVLLPAVATSMQVASARSDAGICSVHVPSPASGDGGRAPSTHALDCVVCAFAAAGAADGPRTLVRSPGPVHAARPDAASPSIAAPPAFLHPPGQAPPRHA